AVTAGWTEPQHLRQDREMPLDVDFLTPPCPRSGAAKPQNASQAPMFEHKNWIRPLSSGKLADSATNVVCAEKSIRRFGNPRRPDREESRSNACPNRPSAF